MNKKEWVDAVTNRTGQSKEIVTEILEGSLEEIYLAMKREEKVTLNNFGTFYIDVRHSGTVFKFNPSQKWKALFGWSSPYKGNCNREKKIAAAQPQFQPTSLWLGETAARKARIGYIGQSLGHCPARSAAE